MVLPARKAETHSFHFEFRRHVRPGQFIGGQGANIASLRLPPSRLLPLPSACPLFLILTTILDLNDGEG